MAEPPPSPGTAASQRSQRDAELEELRKKQLAKSWKDAHGECGGVEWSGVGGGGMHCSHEWANCLEDCKEQLNFAMRIDRGSVRASCTAEHVATRRGVQEYIGM